MDLIFTNPAGLWALLGIPAVLAIHLLQRQARPMTISTRFLLEQTRQESIEGRRIERLRSSIPLWLQLLLVLVLAWLLVDARWLRKDSVQRTAVVLDSSASMQAFKSELIEELPKALTKISSRAGKAEFVVIDSFLAGESLYHGAELSALVERVRQWQPLQGAHELTPSLEIARSLVGKEGSILLVTDHPPADGLPFDTRVLSVGHPKANVGFTGFRLSEEDDGLHWKALIRNYSDEVQERKWSVAVDRAMQPARAITLEPGQTRSLGGPFPEGVDRIALELEPDDFAIDDRLPLIRPLEKPVSVLPSGNETYDALFRRALESIPAIDSLPPPDGKPDLLLTTYNPLNPSLPDQTAIVAVSDRRGKRKALQGTIVPVHHPLTEGLNWQALVAQSSLGVPALETDEVLLWQGDRPLIFLRTHGGPRRLVFNFDPTASNVERFPAFVLTISRFIEQFRDQKVALEHLNAETGQPLDIAVAPSAGAGTDEGGGGEDLALRWDSVLEDGQKKVPLAQRSTLRAPREPGFFELRQGDTVLVNGAALFADTREADLTGAASMADLDELAPALIERHTRSDPYWKLWVALAGLILLLNWHFTARRAVRAAEATSMT